MNDAKTTIERRLANARSSGRLDGLTIEYWKGGGLPPPYHVSQQLRVMSAGGNDAVVFDNETWDAKYTPQNVHERWTAVARPEDVRSVAAMILDGDLLGKRFAEEDDPGIADILSHEIILAADGVEVKKTYFRSLPAQMQPLKQFFDDLIQRTKAQAEKILYHQGRRIN